MLTFASGIALGWLVGAALAFIWLRTAARLREQAIIHDACHDSLTGLANRTLFLDRVAQRMRHARSRGEHPFAVMYLDLDRFKLVNDSLGHSLGDQLLIETARRLETSVRPGDTVSRLGGDEFTLLLEDVPDEAAAMKIADRIHDSLGLPVRLSGQEVFSTTSVGVALLKPVHTAPEDILRDADAAMYRAKSRGPGRTEVFDHGMHIASLAVLQTETDLRRAIERKELRVYYQPIVDLATGGLHGFEALIRWQHPVRGLIGPSSFIQVAEEAGLVIELDRWVLTTACAQLADWSAAHPSAQSMRMNVNLSAKQFSRTDLVAFVDSVLSQAGIDRAQLGLEITESAIMEGNGHAKETLARLSALGTPLHLDDFGTGYSSLSYLHSFPISAVKIDRSFVVNMNETRERALVQAIVTMGHALKLQVTAEGVETDEQVLALRELGCDHAQGYLFSQPVEAIDAERLIVRNAEDGRWAF